VCQDWHILGQRYWPWKKCATEVLGLEVGTDSSDRLLYLRAELFRSITFSIMPLTLPPAVAVGPVRSSAG
jgi:hypothetical protein